MDTQLSAELRAELSVAPEPRWDVLFVLLPDSLVLDWAGPGRVGLSKTFAGLYCVGPWVERARAAGLLLWNSLSRHRAWVSGRQPSVLLDVLCRLVPRHAFAIGLGLARAHTFSPLDAPLPKRSPPMRAPLSACSSSA